MTFVEFFGDTTSLSLWDPTSSKVIFPLIFGRFKAAALSAWNAARAAWADEPLVRLPPATPETYRRAAPAILCGAVVTALLYSMYRSRSSRRTHFREAYPRLPEAATTPLRSESVEEDFYVRPGSADEICSDLVLPSDLLRQADKVDADWINRVEGNFDVDIRITTTETRHAVVCFVGSSRNIHRAKRYLKSFFRELIDGAGSRHRISSVELTVPVEKEHPPSLSVDHFQPADVPSTSGRTPISGSVAGLGDVPETHEYLLLELMHRNHFGHEELSNECRYPDSPACDPKNLRLQDVGHCAFSQLRYRNLPFEKLIGFDYGTFPERRLTEAATLPDSASRTLTVPLETFNGKVKWDNGISASAVRKPLDESPAHLVHPFEEDRSGIIRSYRWSGYQEAGPTPLPRDLSIHSVIQPALNATTLHHHPRVEKLFFQKWVLDITIDTFWFIYLEQFCKDRKQESNVGDRAKLFHRIAIAYGDASLASRGHQSRRTPVVFTTAEEEFHKVFPDILAQSVYCALCLAFPVSIANNFATVNFLDGLCELIWLWFCCGPPPSHLWHGWNLVELQGPVKYYDLNSLQIANFGQNKRAEHQRQLKMAKHHRLFQPRITERVNYDSYPEMSRLAIKNGSQVSQPLAAAIKRQMHIMDLSASSTVMDYYLAFKGIDKTKFHGNNIASGVHFSELQLVHDELDQSDTFLSSIETSSETLKKTREMFSKILDLSEAQTKEA